MLGPELKISAVDRLLIDQLESIDKAFIDLVESEGVQPDHFIAPGMPRIRAVLVMLSSGASRIEEVTPDHHSFTHTVLSTELFNIAIKAHDLTLGRRGGLRRRIARRLVGGSMTFLVGHRLSLRALELANQLPSAELLQELVEAMREVQELWDHQQSWTGTPTSADVYNIMDTITGSVFSLACRAGAQLVSAERQAVTALGRFGRHFGVAWCLAEELTQYESDTLEPDTEAHLLDIILDRASENQPDWSIARGVEVYPHIAFHWQNLQSDGTREEAAKFVQMLDSAGVILDLKEKLMRECWLARQSIAVLEPSEERDSLHRLVDALVRPDNAERLRIASS